MFLMLRLLQVKQRVVLPLALLAGEPAVARTGVISQAVEAQFV